VADLARLDDDELLRLSRDQPDAFGVFYERHVRAVLSHLRRQGLGVEEALDLTGEIFAAALTASARYRPGEAPAAAWLFGIARNKLWKHRRSEAAEVAARRKLRMARLSFSDEALERVEDLLDTAPQTYTNGMADLPPAEREAVLARWSRSATTRRSPPRRGPRPPRSASG
jgi:DNA-directed RNA polymerase specialized sigma24 family protein